MGRGGGLLVVTLETNRGGAATRLSKWQQHTLNFARMIALPQRSVRQFIRKHCQAAERAQMGKVQSRQVKAQSRQVSHGYNSRRIASLEWDACLAPAAAASKERPVR